MGKWLVKIIKTYWFTGKMVYLFSLSVHCFNELMDDMMPICPDLEVSYLIECKLPLEQDIFRVQRRNQQNKFICAINNA